MREATPFGEQPMYLFRDNDGIFGYDVRTFLASCGVEGVRTAYRSPWQNPYIKWMIGTLRGELLDHVIVGIRGILSSSCGSISSTTLIRHDHIKDWMARHRCRTIPAARRAHLCPRGRRPAYRCYRAAA